MEVKVRDMKLNLNNIGNIKKASIEINGITVIAGENGTGKSTIGKALYCLFDTFHNINEKINEERISLVYRSIYIPVRPRMSILQHKLRKLSEEICNDKDYYIENTDELKQKIEQILVSYQKYVENIEEYNIESISDRVTSFLKLDDNTIKANVLNKILSSEFHMQIKNVNEEDVISGISLEVRKKKIIDVKIKDNKDTQIEKSEDIYSNLAYIEDPFIIDELDDVPFLFRSSGHRQNLISLLLKERDQSVVSNVMEEMVVSEKLDHIFNFLNSVCEGDLVKAEGNYAYTSAKYKKPLVLSNISTGLKTFLILKTLFMNGSIEEGGTIVLDEPEIHLHPEWQLLFAELIVLIHKEFKVHVLLNTHSPYFLRAIQVYSAKYRIADKCKYYLSEIENGFAFMTDVSEDIDKIYQKLYIPLQQLEGVEWSDD